MLVPQPCSCVRRMPQLFDSHLDRIWREEMPEPLAALYADHVRAAPGDELHRLLALVEGVSHFLAVVALASGSANGVADDKIRKLLGDWLPLSFGKSLHVIKEALAAAPAHFCPELQRWWREPSTVPVLERLVSARNGVAHYRGPSGVHASVEASRDLAAVARPALEGLDFLGRYSLGWLTASEAARPTGWSGHWQGLRGDRRRDDDGAVAGSADRPPVPHELLLVSPDGKVALCLSPLLRVAPVAGTDCLAILTVATGDSAVVGAEYSKIEAQAARYRAKADAEVADFAAYRKAPNEWHTVVQLHLDRASHTLMLGHAHAAQFSKVKLQGQLRTAAHLGMWQAADATDGSLRLAVPLDARLSSDLAERERASASQRQVQASAAPRFLSIEPIDGKLHWTFELVDGEDPLTRTRSANPQDPDRAARIVLPLLEAMADAHRNGLSFGRLHLAGAVVMQGRKLRLAVPALPPASAADAATVATTLLADRHGAKLHCNSFEFDVAACGALFAGLCGVAFTLGHRPPDLRLQGPPGSDEVFAWFDHAVRAHGDGAKFRSGVDAWQALRNAVANLESRPTQAWTSVQSAPQEQRPALAARQSPPTLPAPQQVPVVSASEPEQSTRSTGGVLRGILLAAVVAIGTGSVAWWLLGESPRGPSPKSSSGAVAKTALPLAPVPLPEPLARHWGPAFANLPAAESLAVWTVHNGLGGALDLLNLSAASAEKQTVEGPPTDVRPNNTVRVYRPTTWAKSLTVEVNSDGIARIGRLKWPSTPTCAAIDASLPLADGQWPLACGGKVRLWAFGSAALTLYHPVDESQCEWWLYRVRPDEHGAERQIAEAYACSDAGVVAWGGGDGERAVELFRKAVEHVPSYGKAAARGCEVAKFVGKAYEDLCAIAERSNFPEVRNCAARIRDAFPTRPDKLCVP